MSAEITLSGVEIDTFAEILDRLADGYRNIYGDDVNFDQDSPDGQRVGIFAKEVLDLEAFAMALYNAMDPDLAQGRALESISKLAGIYRTPATRSYRDVDIVSSRTLTLPAGYTITDAFDQQWILDADVALTTSPQTVTFGAVLFGPVQGDAATELQQATVVPGITSLAGNGDPSSATAELTDEEFRLKRNRGLLNPAHTLVGNVTAKLLNLGGVTDVRVYENSTDTTDSIGVPSHSVWCVVDGGDSSDIAETLARYLTAGTGLKGDVVGSYEEDIVRPDGSTFTYVHEIRFDRPTDADLYVRLNATRTVTGSPVDTDAIGSALAAVPHHIGGEVAASKLYETAYAAGTNFRLSDLEVSDDGSTWTDEAVSPDPDGRFTLDVSNVTVTEII